MADTAALERTDVKGKAVAMVVAPIPTQPAAQFTIRGNFQATTAAMLRAARCADRAGGRRRGDPHLGRIERARRSVRRHRHGVVARNVRDRFGGRRRGYVCASADAEPKRAGDRASWRRWRGRRGRGGGGRGRGNATTIPALWVRNAALEAARSPNAKLVANVVSETFYYPSGNVIGVVKGTDPRLAHEYVLYSGHQDHDGTRYVVNGDSIWNGADDNASVSVAMLAIARAFVAHPAPRPILFVWHGAEERGLLGSRWYVNHSTVPHSEIVAVLNGDMIGRNDPDSAALLGAQPPHRNSVALVDDALRANAELTHFKLDTVWDRPSHPEGWYFRSDHLPYARAGIPAIEFSTLLHPDYHTPRDEPSRIDIPKLARMTQWMYATGWIVANAAQRPDVIPGFKLER